MVEIRDDGLSGESLPNLCRLCLKTDDFIVDIFHRLDPNPNKKPLPERIYDLYQVKVKKSEGLPTNICHRCLYFTEAFSEFRDNVRKCEARLQNFIASIGILGSVKPQNLNSNTDGIKTETTDNTYISIEDYGSTMPDNNSLVTVVDPNQEYESSNEDFSLDSDEEYPIQHHQISHQVQTSSDVHINDGAKDNNFTFQDENSDSLSLRNVFLCQYCDMAFTSQIECAEHESRHDAANPHSCNYCPFRCSNRQTVITHIKELHDNERPFVCVQCDKTFGRRSDLKKHTTVHTGIRPFSCPVCGKNFSRNTNLTKHLRIHTSLRPYVCQKCPRSFTTPEDLRRHERVHNNQKIFQCTQCPSTFTRKEKLLNHELTHTRKAQRKSGSGKKSTKSSEIQKLNQIIQQQRQQQQQQQLQQEQQQQHLNQLSRTENMIIPLHPFIDINQTEKKLNPQDSVFNKPMIAGYTPSMANENISIESNKMITDSQQQQQQPQHQQGDIKNPPEQKRKRELRRNFICPICLKAFLRRRELQRHSMVHTGIKPFPCQYCPKRFSRKDKANRHEKSHFEDKLSCPHCTLTFPKQSALDMHLKVHESNKALPPAPSSSSSSALHSSQQLMPVPGAPFGQPIGFHQSPQQQQYQRQHPMMMMTSQPMPQMSMYHQSFQYSNYRPPQLNFYNEIQPENSEN